MFGEVAFIFSCDPLVDNPVFKVVISLRLFSKDNDLVILAIQRTLSAQLRKKVVDFLKKDEQKQRASQGVKDGPDFSVIASLVLFHTM
ncbi:hypothetical protein DGG96_08350 [Legionella qingyii]|uniref:Uncharacterized protein n=1 Tax=Legionella qingyii TaxID=2184757 RepID=A0A317U271_9GAMM|nr:hypothetical protein DGG96_08350 [Legionella qingyii]